MENKGIAENKSVKESSRCRNMHEAKKDTGKRVFCPACGKYVFSELIIAGICKDCLIND